MTTNAPIFLGIDCGATTSKINGVNAAGEPLSTLLRQTPTPSEQGPKAILAAWMNGVEVFLEEEGLDWDQVAGVGVAMPGPYEGYGVLGPMPNMADSVEGWTYLRDLEEALRKHTGRAIPVVTANDGQLAGIPEARLLQQSEPGSVLMLAPGSGLGCSFVQADGRLLEGDHQAAVILCHTPIPFHLLQLPPFSCGCGRTWGCAEAYTSISGLSQYLEHLLPQFPDHPLHQDGRPLKQRTLLLRSLAQEQDPLALAIFDLQARAMGITVAMGCMAYDPTHVVIGGGLMDPGATTPEFRQRYLDGIRTEAKKHLWVRPDQVRFHQARLGEHAQAVGAAIISLQHTL